MSLDLDQLEAEAKEQLRPVNDGTPKRLHHTILALISELRDARKALDNEIYLRSGTICDLDKSQMRLQSAEDALRFYTDFEQSKCVCPDGSFVAKTEEARAHFERFGASNERDDLRTDE